MAPTYESLRSVRLAVSSPMLCLPENSSSSLFFSSFVRFAGCVSSRPPPPPVGPSAPWRIVSLAGQLPQFGNVLHHDTGGACFEPLDGNQLR
jgi:hypothetical protein